MRILVVDEETPARAQLRQLITEIEGSHALAGELSDGRDVISCCSREPIDIVLMDLATSGIGALDAARRLGCLDPAPAVVFMTGPDQPSPEGLNGEVAGCLRKPIERERLQEVLRRLSHIHQRLPSSPESESTPAGRPERRRQIKAQYRGKVQVVAVRDVLYLHADQKYVTVRHGGGELLVDESLRSFELEFPDLFLRIHRHTLVARNQVAGLERDPDGVHRILLRDCAERLPVSRRHLSAVRFWMCNCGIIPGRG